MEEILASIRRIIADDGMDAAKPAAAAVAPAPAPQPRAAPAPAPEPAKPAMSQDDIDAMLADQAADDGDVLELDDPVSPPQAVATPAATFRPVPASDVVFREEPEPAPPVSYQEPEAPAERLLSSETNAAVSAAFGSLATTILSENSRTIEDLVREMLRPMLKAWLDDNLPGLVERMVRAEIERVSRGGR